MPTITPPGVAGKTSSDDGPGAHPSGDDQMTVTWHRPHPQTVLVRVFGEVDLSTAPRLRQVLGDAARLVATDDPPAPAPRRVHGDEPDRRAQVVCDLSGVAFLGAAGLGALVETDHAAGERRVRLRVVVGSRRVRRIVALSGLDDHLDTVEQLVDVTPPVPHTTPGRSTPR